VGYGTFITVSVNFIIIPFVLFLIIRGLNRVMIKEQEPPPPPAPPTKDQVLLTEIRDLLRGRV
jgi:large conductance mechanosensitive channel